MRYPPFRMLDHNQEIDHILCVLPGLIRSDLRSNLTLSDRHSPLVPFLLRRLFFPASNFERFRISFLSLQWHPKA